MSIIIQVIAAFFASLFFSVLFNTARKELIYCGSIGAVAWFFYIVSFELTFSKILSSFFGALAVGILACLFAKYRKAPVTIFLVAGVIPLVPGAGMYQTMYSLVSNNYELTIFELLTTLQIAGSIAIALALPLTFMIKSRKE